MYSNDNDVVELDDDTVMMHMWLWQVLKLISIEMYSCGSNVECRNVVVLDKFMCMRCCATLRCEIMRC